MEKETNPGAVESGQQPVEDKNLPDNGELNDGELDEVNGGMASLKLMGEILSNVSKTRSEISMTFARNSRA